MVGPTPRINSAQWKIKFFYHEIYPNTLHKHTFYECQSRLHFLECWPNKHYDTILIQQKKEKTVMQRVEKEKWYVHCRNQRKFSRETSYCPKPNTYIELVLSIHAKRMILFYTSHFTTHSPIWTRNPHHWATNIPLPTFSQLQLILLGNPFPSFSRCIPSTLWANKTTAEPNHFKPSLRSIKS